MLKRSRTTVLLSAGALTVAGAALLMPSPASASASASPEALVAAADTTAAGHARLLTPAQRRELRSTGHIVISKHTAKHGTVTVLVQRGEVLAVSASSISVKSKDGYTHSYAITPKTKVREQGQPVDLSDVKVGERAMVVALRTKDGDVARRIGCLRAAAGSTS